MFEMTEPLTGTGGPALKPTYNRRVHVSAEPAGWLKGLEAVDKLVSGTGLVLGDVLQVDSLLQEDLPLDTSPVVSLNRIDHLDTQTYTWYTIYIQTYIHLENTTGMNVCLIHE